MKKRVLPIALLLALGLVACGPTTPEGPESSAPDTSEATVSKIEITNKDELTKEWHAKDEEHASRTIKVRTDVQINIQAALKAGDIKVTSSDENVIKPSGFVLIAVNPGTAKITVQYKDTTPDSVEITLGEPVVAPVIGLKALREGITAGTYVEGNYVDFYGKVVATVEPTTDPDKGQLHNGVWLADGDYAMLCYAGKMKELWAEQELKMGDSVYVKGKLAPYNGLNEVKPSEFRKMTADDKYTIAEPTVLTVNAANFSAEGLAGQDGRRFTAKDLIYVDGAITKTDDRATLNFKWVKEDGSEVKVPLSVNYHIGVPAMKALKAKTDTLAPGNKVNMEGVISWYNAPQLELQFIGDKTPADCLTIGEQPDPTKITISGANTVKATEFIELKVAAEPAGASPAVTWSVDNEAIAKIDENGKLTGIAEGEVVVTATSKKVNTVTATHKVTVTKAPLKNGPVFTDTFDVGGSYKLGIKLQANGETGYITSTIADHKLAPAESYKVAPTIVINAVEGGYQLVLDGKVMGIERSPKEEAGQYFNNICFDKADAELVKNTWLYDATLNTFHVQFADTDYDDIYLGNRANNTTFEVGTTPRKYSTTNNLVHLVDYVVNPIEAETVTAGKIMLGYNDDGKQYYFNGQNSSHNIAKTDNIREAGIIELVAVEGGFNAKIGDKYLSLTSGDFTNITVGTTKTVWTYDAKLKTIVSKVGEKTFCPGTKTSYIDFKPIDVTKMSGNAPLAVYVGPEFPTAYGINLTAPSTSMYIGASIDVTGNLYPNFAIDEVEFVSSAENVATVDANGTVTGIAAGKTTITGTVKGTELKDTIEITVAEAPAGFTVAEFGKTELSKPKNGNAIGTLTKGDVSMTSSGAKWYDSGNAVRMYSKNTVEFKSATGKVLNTIKITVSEPTALAAEMFSVTNATAVIDGDTIIITANAGATSVVFKNEIVEKPNQIRFTAVSISYQNA